MTDKKESKRAIVKRVLNRRKSYTVKDYTRYLKRNGFENATDGLVISLVKRIKNQYGFTNVVLSGGRLYNYS